MAGYKRVRSSVVSESGERSTFIAPEGIKVPTAGTKLTVGEVEKLTDVSVATLRHYDNVGLLSPERTGEDVANDRKLYGVDDLDRLQAILTLREYDFSLGEIKAILDGEVDIHVVMTKQLDALRRRERRLRSLILFTKFVEVTDTELFEGLALGPADLDYLSRFTQGSPAYVAAMGRLEGYSDDEVRHPLAVLDAIIDDYATLGESSAFDGVAMAMERFCAWWDEFVGPIKDLGYLGFWAVFEDHGLVSERIEQVGGTGAAGDVGMHLFYLMMVGLMRQLSGVIGEMARLSDIDVVAAIEQACELTRVVDAVMGWHDVPADAPTSAELGRTVLGYMANILRDEELRRYLDPEGLIDIEGAAIERALQVLAIM